MSRKQTEFVKLVSRFCEACWECIPAGPRQVIGRVIFPGHRYVVFRHADRCVGCGTCVQVCRQHVCRWISQPQKQVR